MGGDSLATYRAKRDFAVTAEPRGGKRRDGEGRFVVQKHAARRLHFDFRLEIGGVLKSWAVTRGPSLDPGEKRLAVRTEDHPLEYGTFEGTIPQGQYGGGTVMLWDEGTWTPAGDPRRDLEAGKLSFTLHGARLKGEWTLVRMRRKNGERRENWLLIKAEDERAGGTDPVLRWRTSVASGRDMSAIASGKATPRARPKRRAARASVPRFTPPALATLVETVPTGPGWLHEIKFDGYRVQVIVADGKARIHARSGADWTERYPSLARAFGELGVDAVFDAEAAVADAEGRTDFSALQRALAERDPVSCYVFDLLWLDGEDWRDRPLRTRKARLKRLLAGAPASLHFSDHIEGSGEEIFAEACRRGIEGVVSKRGDAPYRSGRRREWLKVKCLHRQEVVIGGWRPSQAAGRPLSSLLVGTFDGDRLDYRGRVGTGFDAALLDKMKERVDRLARKTPPFAAVPASVAREACWVTPTLVAEIAFAERTPDGVFRHPVFLGLREDKEAGEVTLDMPADAPSAEGHLGKEDAEVAGVRLSHPDRVLFPGQGITKAGLARYLESVAPKMLVHVARHPLTLVRCPQGRARKCFFQKHHTDGLPDALHAVKLRESGGKPADYLHVDSAAGLVAAAQIGVLEFHIWGATIDDPGRPDRLVFDLDPDPAVGFDEVKRAARDLRALLGAADLESFALLTGGKGIHVVVPLRPDADWPAASAFARSIAAAMAKAAPERFVERAA